MTPNGVTTPQWIDDVAYPYYPQTSNISHTLLGNKIVDHWDVVGASPVGIAPTTFFILDLTPGKTRQETFEFWDLVWLILEVWQ